MIILSYNNKTIQTIKILQKLKKQLAGKNPGPRIKFASLVLSTGLYKELGSDDLYKHDIGERDFDTCFEMNDANLVVHGIIKQAIKSPSLKENIEGMGAAIWPAWFEAYQKVESKISTQHDLI